MQQLGRYVLIRSPRRPAHPRDRVPGSPDGESWSRLQQGMAIVTIPAISTKYANGSAVRIRRCPGAPPVDRMPPIPFVLPSSFPGSGKTIATNLAEPEGHVAR